MKKKNFLWSLLTTVMAITLSVGLTSCSPDPDPDSVSVSTNSVQLSEIGGTQTINVKSNTKWTISSNAGWLQVSPNQGSGDGTFTITASANTEQNSRNCILTINAGNASTVVSVTQSAQIAPPTPSAITIINNSSSSYTPLYIVFRNSAGEQLNQENLGDLHPGGSKSTQIPGSAASWFLAVISGNTVYFTADHLISETTFTITNATTWYYN